MKHTKLRRKAAFTLAELVVVMAISAIVVGLVTSYIIFAQKFNQRSQMAHERVEQFAMLRRQIDDWFSFADSSGYEIAINTENDSSLPLVYLKDADGNAVKIQNETNSICGISLVQSQSAGLTFCFPPIGDTVRADLTIYCKYITNVKFTEFDINADVGATLESQSALRFTISTAIQKGVYACEFLY